MPPLPAICTSVAISLHPITADESAVFVPFVTLAAALDFSRECAVRRIGLAIGVLGGEYISTFLSPTKTLAAEVKDVFRDKLKHRLPGAGDRRSPTRSRSVKEMGFTGL